MGAVIPFEPGAALARVEVTPSGFAIDCRSAMTARHYSFTTAGGAAEFAVLLRDEGNWRLRFREGTDEVRAVVQEIDEMNAGNE